MLMVRNGVQVDGDVKHETKTISVKRRSRETAKCFVRDKAPPLFDLRKSNGRSTIK